MKYVKGGLRDKRGHLMVWHSCEDCGKWRLEEVYKGEPRYVRCVECAGKLCGSKRRKERTYQEGYVVVKLNLDSPYYSMCHMKRKDFGYILEHRLVMAKHLERCLISDEHIHHINDVRYDNRLENLQLTSRGEHKTLHTGQVYKI